MNINNKKYNIISYSLIAIGLCIYVSLLGGKYIWADESYTFAIIQHSFKDIWLITAADVHPPLYYYILKILLAPFNNNLYVAKIVSILPFGLLLLFSRKIVSELVSQKASIIFLLLFVTYPYILYYAYEVRMYSWASFFVFMAFLYSIKCCRQDAGKDWILYGIFTICAAYTHYFALVSVGITGICLLAYILLKNRKLFKKWVIFFLACVISYIPWITCFINQLKEKISNEYWIEKISRYTIYTYWRDILGADGLKYFYLIFTVVIIICFVSILWTKDTQAIVVASYSLLIPFATLFIGVAASILIRPVFIIRYLTPALPCGIFFLAYSISRIRVNGIGYVILIILLTGFGFHYKSSLETEYAATDKTIDYNFVQNSADAYIVLTYPQVASVLSYYDSTKPIYGDLDTSIAANPFENRFMLEAFDYKEKNILLLTNAGGDIPDYYLDMYDVYKQDTITVTGMLTDVYYLTR